MIVKILCKVNKGKCLHIVICCLWCTAYINKVGGNKKQTMLYSLECLQHSLLFLYFSTMCYSSSASCSLMSCCCMSLGTSS